MTHDHLLNDSALGKQTNYSTHYSPSLLYPVPRALKRDELLLRPLQTGCAFYGADLWNAYELSWLNSKNKPEIALAQFLFPCDSPNLIESKSFKLYLHSLNETVFSSWDDIKQTLTTDLSRVSLGMVSVKLFKLHEASAILLPSLRGESLDDLDVACEKQPVQVELLTTTADIVQETLCSDLLKSNCLVTGQPDWGSVQISYRGPKINREGLLRYLISYRYHQGFHEHCVERIFADILTKCRPEELTVDARYTRRGGLDINPYRSTSPITPTSTRLIRQ